MKENARILVIDDDPGIRNAFTRVFFDSRDRDPLDEGRALFGEEMDPGKFGRGDPHWDLELAEDGHGGEAAFRESFSRNRPFAVVFSDMKMPGMTGAETAARIWKIDPRAKIVIMTAYSEFKPEEMAQVAGRADLFYLRKPFNRSEISQFARALAHQWALEREREHLQEKLAEANARLEEKVAHRTRQLAEANRHLAVLDHDKMSFLRYLSHEMNTPLNWIGTAGFIDREPMAPEDREMLGFVENGFERLSDLVREVIDYFEMAGADLQLELETVGVETTLMELIAARRKQIGDRGLKVAVRLDSRLTVTADRYRFIELVLKILDNAIHYSAPGGTITISGGDPGAPFCLVVQDQGKGIPQKNLKTIFEAFATESFDRREAGLGLNLPRARLIAEAHGWHIRAESEGPGKGARIIVEAPS